MQNDDMRRRTGLNESDLSNLVRAALIFPVRAVALAACGALEGSSHPKRRLPGAPVSSAKPTRAKLNDLDLFSVPRSENPFPQLESREFPEDDASLN